MASKDGVHGLGIQVPVAVTEEIEPGADEDDVAFRAATGWPEVEVESDGVGDCTLPGRFPAGVAGESDRRLGGWEREAVGMSGLLGSFPVQIVQERGDVCRLPVKREAVVGRDG